MVDDPRVVLIKLADRLHNMRTIYALSLPKALAVAQETLSIWCSLASRLGVWALKAELEDLCFAVLLPRTFQNMRAELSSMWHPSNRARNLRRLSTKAGFIVPLQETNSIPNHDLPVSTNEERENMRMKRKDVSISQIYDARALRVVVGDKNGKLHGPAVKSCYGLLNIIHRLWTPIDGEFDDYIVNPKPSGYQSLHTAVQGPDSSPLEVQIRTQLMHEYAEFGLAAHWLYKENGIHNNYASLKVGHPVLRVEGSQLLAAVIVRVDKGGRELLVAVSFDLEASEAVAERRSSIQKKRWEDYAKLYKKVSDSWWFAPGHGDWCTCLEKYTLSRDGIFHKEDQFQRLLPTFIQIIDLTEQEETEYWMVMSAVFEGKQILPVPSDSTNSERSSSQSFSYTSTEDGINNKVYLLRTMLQWEKQVRHGATLGSRNGRTSYGASNSMVLGEVVIIRWPHGEIMRMRSGSTAADAARRIGLEGKLVLVNGQLVLPHTELKDALCTAFADEQDSLGRVLGHLRVHYNTIFSWHLSHGIPYEMLFPSNHFFSIHTV
ncbi:hypothetical protein J5N97_018841 [Dioscorea zingiberensis]|uniref:RelA/SpoT domain-containing protein n=1 Tax=Dioscorea zingiberensis TaxID=325984 RepID=A0A9D5CCW4_9LILI|nr:hypothetical protein J5N97_018841 [Dioscorea zingiberensis]